MMMLTNVIGSLYYFHIAYFDALLKKAKPGGRREIPDDHPPGLCSVSTTSPLLQHFSSFQSTVLSTQKNPASRLTSATIRALFQSTVLSHRRTYGRARSEEKWFRFNPLCFRTEEPLKASCSLPLSVSIHCAFYTEKP